MYNWLRQILIHFIYNLHIGRHITGRLHNPTQRKWFYRIRKFVMRIVYTRSVVNAKIRAVHRWHAIIRMGYIKLDSVSENRTRHLIPATKRTGIGFVFVVRPNLVSSSLIVIKSGGKAINFNAYGEIKNDQWLAEMLNGYTQANRFDDILSYKRKRRA